MEIYTIGFTQTSAERFFKRLTQAKVKRLVDIRLKNDSQLAGFAKAIDLAFFLQRIGGITYEHQPLLAPTQELLDGYRKRNYSWEEYEDLFIALMHERQIERQLDRDSFEVPTVLLCSEATAEQCHRRLVCEHLVEHWKDVQAVHL